MQRALTVATCQFPVSGDIEKNLTHTLTLIAQAKEQGAQVTHFSESSLSARIYQEEGREMGSLITGTVRGRAANNHLWISASNTSQRESCFAGFVVQPDGRLLHQLKRNVAGVLISQFDLSKAFADPSGPWRDRAIQGILHSNVLEKQE